jgi:uncharacterized protein (DUF1810 family)
VVIAQHLSESDEPQHISHHVQAAGHVGLANGQLIPSTEDGQAFGIAALVGMRQRNCMATLNKPAHRKQHQGPAANK